MTITKPAFHSVAADPIHVQQYTLSNGLRLFLTVNKEEPRIYTEIAVRAGSKHDPADSTGLAHYFEHMMFNWVPSTGPAKKPCSIRLSSCSKPTDTRQMSPKKNACTPK
jgi:predicted Zn-dependent peptidase